MTPDEFVAASRDVPDVEIRDRYLASAEKMATEVAGARLVTGDDKPRVTRLRSGVRRDAETAAIVDALAGRGRLEDALPDAQADVVSRVDALARYFRTREP